MDNRGIDNGHELGWDDVIENDGEFIILPPNDYDFVVKEWKEQDLMVQKKCLLVIK